MKRKVGLTWMEVLSRITGVSALGVGVSWKPPESERKIIRALLVYIEDRRAITIEGHPLEGTLQVNESILGIRRELTKTLQRLDSSSHAVDRLRKMRLACQRYLETRSREMHSWSAREERAAHEAFRQIVGEQIGYLAVEYGIDLETELAKWVLPRYSGHFQIG